MKVDFDLLMRTDDGTQWNKYKSSLVPLYPGYENFCVYMDWLKK